MGLSKFFLNTGEALRPVLTKIIPMKLLSKMKAGIMPQTSCRLILLKNMRQEDTNVVPI